MNIAGIRAKLHNYLEQADDNKLKALYSVMEEEIESHDIPYSEEFKKELDRRYDEYISGKAILISPEESKARIQKLLNSKK